MSLDGNAVKISERIGAVTMSAELNSLENTTTLKIVRTDPMGSEVMALNSSEEVSTFIKMLEDAQQRVDIL